MIETSTKLYNDVCARRAAVSATLIWDALPHGLRIISERNTNESLTLWNKISGIHFITAKRNYPKSMTAAAMQAEIDRCNALRAAMNSLFN